MERGEGAVVCEGWGDGGRKGPSRGFAGEAGREPGIGGSLVDVRLGIRLGAIARTWVWIVSRREGVTDDVSQLSKGEVSDLDAGLEESRLDFAELFREGSVNELRMEEKEMDVGVRGDETVSDAFENGFEVADLEVSGREVITMVVGVVVGGRAVILGFLREIRRVANSKVEERTETANVAIRPARRAEGWRLMIVGRSESSRPVQTIVARVATLAREAKTELMRTSLCLRAVLELRSRSTSEAICEASRQPGADIVVREMA
ncbi:MAG: hypothetical protein MMC23_000215 [Stictis urceolatum]|nr:hypothetical protein [Stictis urceolata]